MATAVSGKRGPTHGENRMDHGGTDAEKKKSRKSGVKKQPAFKPQPIPLPNSSDTPPDEVSFDLPPPPSERKIARKRDSTRYARDAGNDSPPPPTKRLKPSSASSSSRNLSGQGGEPSRARETERRERGRTMDADGLRDELTMDAASAPAASRARGMPTTPAVDYLSFSASARPRPSMPRPTSPPRFSFATPSAPRMHAEGDRRARKSLKQNHQSRAGSTYGAHDESLIVDVPERETPMIRKNRELREQQRRSSLGSRGQRASESMDNGDISVPHPDIDTRSFYTHISPNLPEPIRARHLLVYCAKKATDRAVRPESTQSGSSKSRSKSGEVRTAEGDTLLAEIMEDFMTKLGRGAVDTNVFAQVGAPPVGVPLRPHPRNIANRDTESAMTAVIKACKDEHHQWLSLISRVNRKKQKTLAAVDKARNRLEPDMAAADEWMQHALSMADGIIAEGEGDLSNMGEFADVEYKVDTLLQSSHTALQYSLQAQRFLDGIFSSLTSDLRARDQPAGSSATQADVEQPDHVSLLDTSAAPRSRGKEKKTDPIHLLRALAAAEAAPRPPPVIEGSESEQAKRERDVPVVTPGPRAGMGKRAAVTPGRTGLGASTSRRGMLSKSTSGTTGA